MFLNNYKANVLQWYDKNKLFVNFFYVVKYSKRCIADFYKKIGYLKEIPQTEARGIFAGSLAATPTTFRHGKYSY